MLKPLAECPLSIAVPHDIILSKSFTHCEHFCHAMSFRVSGPCSVALGEWFSEIVPDFRALCRIKVFSKLLRQFFFPPVHTQLFIKNNVWNISLKCLNKCNVVFRFELLKVSWLYTLSTAVGNHADSNLLIPEKLPISDACVRACARVSCTPPSRSE